MPGTLLRSSRNKKLRAFEPHLLSIEMCTLLLFTPGTAAVHTSKESSKAISSVTSSLTSPDGIIYSHFWDPTAISSPIC